MKSLISNKKNQNAIFANALLLSQKDGLGAINEAHIREATRMVTNEQNNVIKWVLTISSLVLVGFSFLQMSFVYSSFSYLWLLPFIAIIWVVVVAYIFKDFL